MKTYVINLKNATDRRVYMNRILSRYPMLDIEYVNAVNGRKITKEGLEKIFDFKKAAKINPRVPTPPEIGCTMSHIKCYKRLLRSENNVALILEDDIDKPDKDFHRLLPKIERLISNQIPQIILLSDWYWYTKSYELAQTHEMASVVNAYLTHAYIINRKAAKVMTEYKACHIADNWHYIRKLGIQLLAIKPHLIQQKWSDDFQTSIQNKSTSDESVKKTQGLVLVQRFWYNIKFIPKRIFFRLLRSLGHYYAPHSNKSEWDKNHRDLS